MKQSFKLIILIASIAVMGACQQQKLADRQSFDKDWKFMLGDDSLAYQVSYDDGRNNFV